MKQSALAQAKDLYISPLWRARRRYAELSGVPWLILSAKHGLVHPDALLAPYDLALTSLRAAERRAWGDGVVSCLRDRFDDLGGRTFEVHAGVAYRTALQAPLLRFGATVDAPLQGLALGEQLRWYASVHPV